MKPNKATHYFSDCDSLLCTQNQRQTGRNVSPLSSPLTVKEINRQRMFFLQFENQEHYSFDSDSHFSKKQRKLAKMRQKLNSAAQQEDSLNPEPNLPFQDDISSVSYLCEQPTPHDSVISTLMKHGDCSRSESSRQLNSSNIDEQFSSSDQGLQEDQLQSKSQRCDQSERQRQRHQSQMPSQEVSQSQNQQLYKSPRQTQPEFNFKSSSLKFQKVNKYIRNFLKKKPLGIIIYPEYSTYIQNNSQLAAEGKPLRLQFNKKRDQPRKTSPYNQICEAPKHRDFLKEVFNVNASSNLNSGAQDEQLQLNEYNRFQLRQKINENQEETIGYKQKQPYQQQS